VASETVGVPLRELLINFGAARMMVIPLTEDATVVALLERDTAVAPVRSLVALQLESLRLLVAQPESLTAEPIQSETDDDIQRVFGGELGPLLDRIRVQFTDAFVHTGREDIEPDSLMREQVREWLLCCNPSPYTLPLLVDGLGQLLNDYPYARAEFMETVQDTLRSAVSEGA
jgi:hypothetical protein